VVQDHTITYKEFGLLTNLFKRCYNLLFFYRIVNEQKLLVQKLGALARTLAFDFDKGCFYPLLITVL